MSGIIRTDGSGRTPSRAKEPLGAADFKCFRHGRMRGGASQVKRAALVTSGTARLEALAFETSMSNKSSAHGFDILSPHAPTLHRRQQGGWIEVVTGVMFSGKSEELMRRVRRSLIAGRDAQVFKSHLDDRYKGLHQVSSHDGTGVEAIPVSSSLEIAEKVRPGVHVVAIDEAQFLDHGIVRVVNDLADRGLRVILSGTDMDFRGDPFGPIPMLLAIAEQVDKLHAICVCCGELATRNQRLINGAPAPAEGPTIQVGGSEGYEARCRRCHEVPLVLRDQTSLLDEGT